jgi:hypothetical protein
MRAEAQTPEELDTLLEDAFVLRDHTMLAALFHNEGVLGAGTVALARGRLEIAQAAEAMWAREQLYLAAPLRVLQARRTALIAGPSSTSVAQRSRDGAWRYAIALLHADPQPPRSTR